VPGAFKAAASLGAEVFLDVRRPLPEITGLDPSLANRGRELAHAVREHSHAFVRASRKFEEQIITRQCVQARLADSAMWLHAWACVLSRLNADVTAAAGNGHGDQITLKQRRTAALYFMDMAKREARAALNGLFENDDTSMLAAADAALALGQTLPNNRYAIHEASPNARGTGRTLDQSAIPQFPGHDPHAAAEAPVHADHGMDAFHLSVPECPGEADLPADGPGSHDTAPGGSARKEPA
jgi:hypothetical protein